jgi:hypothetical protein
MTIRPIEIGDRVRFSLKGKRYHCQAFQYPHNAIREELRLWYRDSLTRYGDKIGVVSRIAFGEEVIKIEWPDGNNDWYFVHTMRRVESERSI